MKYATYYFTLTFFVAASNNSEPSDFAKEAISDTMYNVTTAPPVGMVVSNKTPKQTIVYYDTIRHYDYTTIYSNIKGTVYHAVASQTDNTPFRTADNSLIDTSKINDLRWVALSRNILKRKFRNKRGEKIVWSGKIKLGDTIYVDYDSITLKNMYAHKSKLAYEKAKQKYEKVKGRWIVKDVMGAYHWKPQKNVLYSDLSDEMKASGEYKVRKNVVFKKSHQNTWIDFLQDHKDKTSMYDSWSERLLIIKKKELKSIDIIKIELPIDALFVNN